MCFVFHGLAVALPPVFRRPDNGQGMSGIAQAGSVRHVTDSGHIIPEDDVDVVIPDVSELASTTSPSTSVAAANGASSQRELVPAKPPPAGRGVMSIDDLTKQMDFGSRQLLTSNVCSECESMSDERVSTASHPSHAH